MLDLAIRLAEREAAGRTLSAEERALSDIMWIGTQVSPNGFDGWLSYTSCERMRRTLKALEDIGCTAILAAVKDALEVSAVDPQMMSDEDRERQVNRLSDADRERLYAVDSRFYDVFEPSMGLCQSYAKQKGIF